MRLTRHQQLLKRVGNILRNPRIGVPGMVYVVTLGMLACLVLPRAASAVRRSRVAWLGERVPTDPTNVPRRVPGNALTADRSVTSAKDCQVEASRTCASGTAGVAIRVMEAPGGELVPVGSASGVSGSIDVTGQRSHRAGSGAQIGIFARAATALVALWLIGVNSDIAGTLADFVAAQVNPAGSIQSGTVKLLADSSTSRGMVFPALLPGEGVERIFTLENGGTLDTSLSLAVIPNTGSKLTADPINGLQLSVDRCIGGQWIVTTPVAGVPTPPVDGQKFACTNVGEAATPMTEHMYVGPIIPRGLTSPGFPTTTPVPIPVNPRLEPGTSASVRLRASLPGLHDEVILRGEPVTSDAAQLAGVVLEWRAVGAVSNAAGTPLSTPVAIPVTATPRATVSPTATATSTATASSTATSTATASATLTAAPSATPPPASYAGYALSFDGLTDDLMVGGAGFATPVALTGRDQWAIEAWVKPSVLSGAHAIYTENVTLADGTEGMVTGLGLQDRSVVVGIWNDTRGTEDKWAWHEALLPPTLEPAQWFHLAASYQSGAVAIVVNGISLPTTASGSQATNGPPNAIPSQTYIGRAGNVDLNSNFAGEMDEFRVWSTARTGSAISQARFQKQLGNEVGLALYYPMSTLSATVGGRGNVVADRSVTGADASLEGGLRWTVSGVRVEVPPTPNNLALLADSSSDSGTIGGGITKSTTVGITGRADPGDRITFLRQGTSISTTPSTVVTSTNGTFSTTLQLLANQTNQLTTFATNDLGMSSPVSAALAITVDTVAPSAPTVVLTSPDTGASSTDRVTSALPVFGVTSSTDATVSISATRGGLPYSLGGATSLTGTGSLVSYMPAAPTGNLPDGAWQFRFVASDVAGNESSAVTFLVTLDTVSPVTPTIQLAGGGTTTTDTTPTFSGSAEAGSVVELLSGSTVLGSTTASVSGSYSITAPTLAIGNYSFSVRSTDSAGNGTTSATVVITVEQISGPDYGAPVVWSRSGQIISGGSAQYSWIAPSSGWVIFGTCGSGFDTTLDVAGTFNDDHRQGSGFCGYGLASYVRLQVNSGTTYPITLSGFGSSSGAYIIEIRYG